MKHCLILLSLSVGATSAFAHVASFRHTHCSVLKSGVLLGVEVPGKTDDERQAACIKVTGATWDGAKALVVEGRGDGVNSASVQTH